MSLVLVGLLRILQVAMGGEHLVSLLGKHLLPSGYSALHSKQCFNVAGAPLIRWQRRVDTVVVETRVLGLKI